MFRFDYSKSGLNPPLHAREGLVIENEEMIAIKALTDSKLVLVVRAK